MDQWVNICPMDVVLFAVKDLEIVQFQIANKCLISRIEPTDILCGPNSDEQIWTNV